jgi:F1F0 ATPase subunit 2
MLVGVEMDQQRMNLRLLDTLPAWAVLLGLAIHLGAGFGLGLLYFRSLWWSVRRFADRGFLVATIVLIGRFALIGGVLTLASFEGALPLLAMALGVVIARVAVTSRVREAAL